MSSTKVSPATIGLAAGVAIFVVMLLVPAPTGMSITAWRVAAVGALMVTWWVTEAVPIPVTALLPLVLFPILGIGGIATVAAPYASPVVFLFLGGFVIAKALEECGLHKRMALGTISIVGSRPTHLIAGFMAATAFISMWVSNTATVVMIYPMAMSVIDRADGAGEDVDSRFARALLLGVAYAANIGGLGTLIGSTPNALLAGFMAETYDRPIGFAEWMLLGVPLVLVALPITWFYLTRSLPASHSDEVRRGQDAQFKSELSSLGPLSRTEWIVGGVTLLVAVSWLLRPLIGRVLPGISDAGIAIAGAVLIFVAAALARSDSALTWQQAEKLPWSVLILFGGGLSLADAVASSGLAGYIGAAASGLESVPLVVLMLIITAVVLMLTELTSNTATAAIFLPIVGSIAVGMGVDPLMLVLPVALAASCAFMMPIATPPNAIVFASGRITIAQMARTGAWINLLMLLLITASMFAIGRYLFG